MSELPAGEPVPEAGPGSVALSAQDRWCWIERARAAARRAAESLPPAPPEAARDVPPADAADTETPVSR